MSQNLKLIIFVVVLGLVTSGLLLGADALTKDRIELNKEAKLKSFFNPQLFVKTHCSRNQHCLDLWPRFSRKEETKRFTWSY